jgi:D-alanine-D-alanine ligase
MNQKDFNCLKEAINNKKPILVSGCLLGMKINYKEEGCLVEELRDLLLHAKAIPVCPEVLAGMTTPRNPAEIVMENGERKVYNDEKSDVTELFQLGAERALAAARTCGAKIAIMKSKSPSCGCGKIYDGTFSGQLIDGDGVTVAYLKAHGIRVISEEDFLECIK